MTKTDFLNEINMDRKFNLKINYIYLEGHLRHIPNPNDEGWWRPAYNDHLVADAVMVITIAPEMERIGPYATDPVFTEIKFPSRTKTAYSQANLKILVNLLKPYFKLWRRERAAYRKSKEYRKKLKEINFFKLALDAGLNHDEHGGYSTRGDHFDLDVISFVYRKTDLRFYHATGKYLGLVDQKRYRVYASSSDWRFSNRSDMFVVGQNESGVPFCHQVPRHIGRLSTAINWIWGNCEVLDRQGDVAITHSNLKNVEGTEDDVQIHDNHRFIGEVYRNGSTHVRSGFLYHTKTQHPTIYLDGSAWRRVIIGRRSQTGMSSAD